jgi:hypothetical protein
MNANSMTAAERFAQLSDEFLANVQRNVPVYLSREDFGDEDKEDFRYCLSQGGKELWFISQANAERYASENSLSLQNCIR